MFMILLRMYRNCFNETFTNILSPLGLYEKNKNQFVNKLIYGEDTPPTDWKKLLDRIDPEPAPEKDRFDECK